VREHAAIYVLATLSNLLLSVPEYLGVQQAIASYVPVDPGTRQLVSSYGVSRGLALDFLWTFAIFQAVLTVIMFGLTQVPRLSRGWRVPYIFSGMVISGFVGYWLGAKFLRSLSWVSLLQNNGVDSSGVYADLFFFGLGATVCYVSMILVLRRSYDKLLEARMPTLAALTHDYSANRGLIFHNAKKLDP